MAEPLILHVEDEADDAFFLELAFRNARMPCRIHRVSDGRQAIDYFSGEGAFCDRGRFPLPRIVLLDLKLPGINGFEVLAWLRVQKEFEHLPVLVLTGSDLKEDRRKAQELGATAYFVKATRYTEIVEYVGRLLSTLQPVPIASRPPSQLPGPESAATR